MKKLNGKTKAEQLFILLLLSTLCFCAFLLTSCGGDASCETIKCGSEEDSYGTKYKGCSIPGCGGCLTSESGFGCVLWPQSFKIMTAKSEGCGGTNLTAIDIRYYGDNGSGCAQTEKLSYTGCMTSYSGEDKISGCYFGDSGIGGCGVGCRGGCFGCLGSGVDFVYTLHDIERMLGIG